MGTFCFVDSSVVAICDLKAEQYFLPEIKHEKSGSKIKN
jgi:hypothetical protein